MYKIKNKPLSDTVFNGTVTVILVAICLVIIIPLAYILSASLSDPYQLLIGNVFLWPIKPTFSMYRRVFAYPAVWQSYGNTIFYTVVGTIFSITLTMLAAYPLSRPEMYKRNVFMLIFTFTMFFSGGMIPSYLLVSQIGFINTPLAMIIPSAVSTYNLIVMRTFFSQNIPTELVESAALDGYNDFQIFIRIAIPLSTSIIAVMALFYGVGYWNSWFPALLYLQDRTKWPLQMILRQILIESDTSDMTGGVATTDREMVGAGLKYATMVFATLPIMLLYPILQRYFVKGVMIGVVKG